MAGRPALRQRRYPTGIPIQPPPGWAPPLPRRASPFRAQVAFIMRTMMLSMLVLVCMGVGWVLVNGRRPARSTEGQVAAAGPKKGQRSEPESPPKEKEAPPRKEKPAPPQKAKEQPPEKEEEQKPPEKQEEQRPVEKTKPAAGALTYEKDVLPILERACTSCHGVRRKSGKLDLRTFAALVKGGEGGTGVVPGNPDKSPLYETVASGQMPPGKMKLSAKEKETIRAWIAAGAKGGK
jgi:hypothetical protein